MFQTLQPLDYRNNKTAYPGKRRRLVVPQQIEQRPSTVGFQQITFQKQQRENHFATLDSAVLEVANSFKKQMNPYIKLRIRSSLSQNNQRKQFFSNSVKYDFVQNTLNYQNPQNLQSTNNQLQPQIKRRAFFKLNQTISSLNRTIISSPINIKQMKLSSLLNQQPKSPYKNQQMVSQSLIAHTKQKISRLLQMKKEKEIKFQQLKLSISNKCQKNHKPMQKKTFIQKYKLNNMEDSNWDQQWKQNTNKQSNRYRNRLMMIHKRSLSTRVTLPLQVKE